MRSGILLAEECPQTLLSLHGLSSLEDVFLKLCMKDRMPPNHRLAGKGVAPLVQTISDGKAQGAPDSAATADGGVDNPAFIQQEHLHSSSSSATTDDASSDGKDEDDDGEMAHNANANNKALSQLSIVSHWPRRFTEMLSSFHLSPFQQRTPPHPVTSHFLPFFFLLLQNKNLKFKLQSIFTF